MARTVAIDKRSWRVYAVWLLLAAGLLAIVVRLLLLQLQVLDHRHGASFLKRQGDARVLRTQQLPASRGLIVDRNGELIAHSTPMISLWAEPSLVDRSSESLRALAQDLSLSEQQLRNKLASDSRFVYLRRRMAPHLADAILQVGYSGLFSQVEYQRFYPTSEVAAHLVGFTNIDDQGQEGMELAYNALLRAEAGAKQVMQDRLGNKIRDIRLLRAAESGADLQLSIDMRLQYAAYRELKSAVTHYRARSGSLVLLDVESGEVLALVNQPSYNPNDRSQLLPADMRNRALIDLFEPGSVVKPFTLAAAIEAGNFSPTTPIDTSPGYFRVGKKIFSDPSDYGMLNVKTVLAKSSQVGTTRIALDIEPNRIRSLFADVGLGEYCATGFPGEQPGYLPSHRRWSDIDRATLAFGHGLTVNALQLARAYAVIANDGLIKPVTLLKQGDSDAGSSRGERVMSARVAGQVRDMMVAVTEKGGTGTAAQVPGYSVAGKTGTSHKVGGAGYEKRKYRSTFAGMLPASDPKLVAVITIDEPGGEKYFGGEIAAPVFSSVMRAAVRLLNIAPDSRAQLAAGQSDVSDPESQSNGSA